MNVEAFLKTHRLPVLSAQDRAALESAATRVQSVAARTIMVRENEPLSQCTMLLKGFIQRYKDSEDGRCQILALHVPGDFVDLHSYPLKRLEHSVAAITPVEIALFPHEAIRALTAQSTVLTELLWRSTLIDAAINREWMMSIGARPADVRVAHLFCELHLRLQRVGMADDRGYDLPLTQIDVADATGLTAVHVNRMLRRIEQAELMVFRNQRVQLHNLPALRDFAEFDPNYLFLD